MLGYLVCVPSFQFFLRAGLILFSCLLVMEFPADAQIYVDNDGGPNSGILEFSLSGQKNSSFYIPEDFPATFAVSGNLLYAVSEPLGANSDSLSVYNASTGSLLQSNLITGLASYSMAVSGNDLYIGSNVGTVGIFNASTGSFEDLVAGSSYITRFAVGGNTLYGVEQSSPGSYTYNIYTFNATTGAQTSSTPLVTGLYGASDSGLSFLEIFSMSKARGRSLVIITARGRLASTTQQRELRSTPLSSRDYRIRRTSLSMETTSSSTPMMSFRSTPPAACWSVPMCFPISMAESSTWQWLPSPLPTRCSSWAWACSLFWVFVLDGFDGATCSKSPANSVSPKVIGPPGEISAPRHPPAKSLS